MSTKSTFLSAIIGFFGGLLATSAVVAVVVAATIVHPDWMLDMINVNRVMTSVSSQSAPELAGTEEEIVSVVERVSPAVVSIVATQDVPVYEQYYEEQYDPFGFEFPGFSLPQYRQNGTEEQEVSSGSGFFVSADGYVVTNKHVVSESEADYTVFTNDGSQYSASVVAKDPANDIAVLKVDGENFSYLEFGDSDTLQVGQTAIAIGNALGEFSNSVSVGVVSGLARSIQAGDGFGQSEKLDGVIQTDAAINFGNSGGPLLNAAGQVIGVNVAVAAAENIGFALPANLVQSVVESVKTTGKISRPFLGVRYIPITVELREANDLPVDYGVLVLRGETPTELAVIPSSPADKAGIEENDILLEIDGQKLDSEHDLSTIIGQHVVGDKVTLQVLHDGEEKEVEVTLEERQ
ncbi:MAG: hypothetical protein ACD_41C00173G0002 [uncultured bacterium]|nr:MAG: hypothetical protein ACD_41C00173G0002 [uncultured bacterium]